jgi:hypothetical protein
MKRSDIQPGMLAVFTRDGVSEFVTVIGPTDGPWFSVRDHYGCSRMALPVELEKRRLPSARRVEARVTLLDIVKAYEQVAETRVPRAEVERMMRAAEGKR